MCTTLRHLFPSQVRGRESRGRLWHTYSVRPGRGMPITTGVWANCLQWQRPADSCNSLGCTRCGGSPSQCLQRPKNLVGGERGCNGGPAPCMPLNNDALLVQCPGILLLTFLVVELPTPVPSGCLFTTNSCFLPGSVLQIPLSSTQHPSTTDDSDWDVQSCGADHACSSYFVLSSISHPLCSPLIDSRSLSIPVDFSIVREFF